MLKIFDPVLGRVKGAHNLHGSSYICKKSLHTKFQTPCTFPSCKKLVVGGWVLKWILLLSLDPSLTTKFSQYYTMIHNFTVKCYELTNKIQWKKILFLSFPIFLRKSVVLATNIWILISNELEMMNLGSISNEQLSIRSGWKSKKFDFL